MIRVQWPRAVAVEEVDKQMAMTPEQLQQRLEADKRERRRLKFIIDQLIAEHDRMVTPPVSATLLGQETLENRALLGLMTLPGQPIKNYPAPGAITADYIKNAIATATQAYLKTFSQAQLRLKTKNIVKEFSALAQILQNDPDPTDPSIRSKWKKKTKAEIPPKKGRVKDTSIDERMVILSQLKDTQRIFMYANLLKNNLEDQFPVGTLNPLKSPQLAIIQLQANNIKSLAKTAPLSTSQKDVEDAKLKDSANQKAAIKNLLAPQFPSAFEQIVGRPPVAGNKEDDAKLHDIAIALESVVLNQAAAATQVAKKTIVDAKGNETEHMIMQVRTGAPLDTTKAAPPVLTTAYQLTKLQSEPYKSMLAEIGKYGIEVEAGVDEFGISECVFTIKYDVNDPRRDKSGTNLSRGIDFADQDECWYEIKLVIDRIAKDAGYVTETDGEPIVSYKQRMDTAAFVKQAESFNAQANAQLNFIDGRVASFLGKPPYDLSRVNLLYKEYLHEIKTIDDLISNLQKNQNNYEPGRNPGGADARDKLFADLIAELNDNKQKLEISSTAFVVQIDDFIKNASDTALLTAAENDFHAWDARRLGLYNANNTYISILQPVYDANVKEVLVDAKELYALVGRITATTGPNKQRQQVLLTRIKGEFDKVISTIAVEVAKQITVKQGHENDVRTLTQQKAQINEITGWIIVARAHVTDLLAITGADPLNPSVVDLRTGIAELESVNYAYIARRDEMQAIEADNAALKTANDSLNAILERFDQEILYASNTSADITTGGVYAQALDDLKSLYNKVQNSPNQQPVNNVQRLEIKDAIVKEFNDLLDLVNQKLDPIVAAKRQALADGVATIPPLTTEANIKAADTILRAQLADLRQWSIAAQALQKNAIEGWSTTDVQDLIKNSPSHDDLAQKSINLIIVEGEFEDQLASNEDRIALAHHKKTLDLIKTNIQNTESDAGIGAINDDSQLTELNDLYKQLAPATLILKNQAQNGPERDAVRIAIETEYDRHQAVILNSQMGVVADTTRSFIDRQSSSRFYRTLTQKTLPGRNVVPDLAAPIMHALTAKLQQTAAVLIAAYNAGTDAVLMSAIEDENVSVMTTKSRFTSRTVIPSVLEEKLMHLTEADYDAIIAKYSLDVAQKNRAINSMAARIRADDATISVPAADNQARQFAPTISNRALADIFPGSGFEKTISIQQRLDDIRDNTVTPAGTLSSSPYPFKNVLEKTATDNAATHQLVQEIELNKIKVIADIFSKNLFSDPTVAMNASYKALSEKLKTGTVNVSATAGLHELGQIDAKVGSANPALTQAIIGTKLEYYNSLTNMITALAATDLKPVNHPSRSALPIDRAKTATQADIDSLSEKAHYLTGVAVDAYNMYIEEHPEIKRKRFGFSARTTAEIRDAIVRRSVRDGDPIATAILSLDGEAKRLDQVIRNAQKNLNEYEVPAIKFEEIIKNWNNYTNRFGLGDTLTVDDLKAIVGELSPAQLNDLCDAMQGLALHADPSVAENIPEKLDNFTASLLRIFPEEVVPPAVPEHLLAELLDTENKDYAGVRDILRETLICTLAVQLATENTLTSVDMKNLLKHMDLSTLMGMAEQVVLNDNEATPASNFIIRNCSGPELDALDTAARAKATDQNAYNIAAEIFATHVESKIYPAGEKFDHETREALLVVIDNRITPNPLPANAVISTLTGTAAGGAAAPHIFAHAPTFTSGAPRAVLGGNLDPDVLEAHKTRVEELQKALFKSVWGDEKHWTPESPEYQKIEDYLNDILSINTTLQGRNVVSQIETAGITQDARTTFAMQALNTASSSSPKVVQAFMNQIQSLEALQVAIATAEKGDLGPPPVKKVHAPVILRKAIESLIGVLSTRNAEVNRIITAKKEALVKASQDVVAKDKKMIENLAVLLGVDETDPDIAAYVQALSTHGRGHYITVSTAVAFALASQKKGDDYADGIRAVLGPTTPPIPALDTPASDLMIAFNSSPRLQLFNNFDTDLLHFRDELNAINKAQNLSQYISQTQQVISNFERNIDAKSGGDAAVKAMLTNRFNHGFSDNHIQRILSALDAYIVPMQLKIDNHEILLTEDYQEFANLGAVIRTFNNEDLNDYAKKFETMAASQKQYKDSDTINQRIADLLKVDKLTAKAIFDEAHQIIQTSVALGDQLDKKTTLRLIAILIEKGIAQAKSRLEIKIPASASTEDLEHGLEVLDEINASFDELLAIYRSSNLFDGGKDVQYEAKMNNMIGLRFTELANALFNKVDNEISQFNIQSNGKPPSAVINESILQFQKLLNLRQYSNDDEQTQRITLMINGLAEVVGAHVTDLVNYGTPDGDKDLKDYLVELDACEKAFEALDDIYSIISIQTAHQSIIERKKQAISQVFNKIVDVFNAPNRQMSDIANAAPAILADIKAIYDFCSQDQKTQLQVIWQQVSDAKLAMEQQNASGTAPPPAELPYYLARAQQSDVCVLSAAEAAVFIKNDLDANKIIPTGSAIKEYTLRFPQINKYLGNTLTGEKYEAIRAGFINNWLDITSANEQLLKQFFQEHLKDFNFDEFKEFHDNAVREKNNPLSKSIESILTKNENILAVNQQLRGGMTVDQARELQEANKNDFNNFFFEDLNYVDLDDLKRSLDNDEIVLVSITPDGAQVGHATAYGKSQGKYWQFDSIAKDNQGNKTASTLTVFQDDAAFEQHFNTKILNKNAEYTLVHSTIAPQQSLAQQQKASASSSSAGGSNQKINIFTFPVISVEYDEDAELKMRQALANAKLNTTATVKDMSPDAIAQRLDALRQNESLLPGQFILESLPDLVVLLADVQQKLLNKTFKDTDSDPLYLQLNGLISRIKLLAETGNDIKIIKTNLAVIQEARKNKFFEGIDDDELIKLDSSIEALGSRVLELDTTAALSNVPLQKSTLSKQPTFSRQGTQFFKVDLKSKQSVLRQQYEAVLNPFHPIGGNDIDDEKKTIKEKNNQDLMDELINRIDTSTSSDRDSDVIKEVQTYIKQAFEMREKSKTGDKQIDSLMNYIQILRYLKDAIGDLHPAIANLDLTKQLIDKRIVAAGKKHGILTSQQKPSPPIPAAASLSASAANFSAPSSSASASSSASSSSSSSASSSNANASATPDIDQKIFTRNLKDILWGAPVLGKRANGYDEAKAGLEKDAIVMANCSSAATFDQIITKASVAHSLRHTLTHRTTAKDYSDNINALIALKRAIILAELKGEIPATTIKDRIQARIVTLKQDALNANFVVTLDKPEPQPLTRLQAFAALEFVKQFLILPAQLDTEGLIRLSSSKSQTDQILALINEDPSLDAALQQDLNVILQKDSKNAVGLMKNLCATLFASTTDTIHTDKLLAIEAKVNPNDKDLSDDANLLTPVVVDGFATEIYNAFSPDDQTLLNQILDIAARFAIQNAINGNNKLDTDAVASSFVNAQIFGDPRFDADMIKNKELAVVKKDRRSKVVQSLVRRRVKEILDVNDNKYGLTNEEFLNKPSELSTAPNAVSIENKSKANREALRDRVLAAGVAPAVAGAGSDSSSASSSAASSTSSSTTTTTSQVAVDSGTAEVSTKLMLEDLLWPRKPVLRAGYDVVAQADLQTALGDLNPQQLGFIKEAYDAYTLRNDSSALKKEADKIGKLPSDVKHKARVENIQALIKLQNALPPASVLIQHLQKRIIFMIQDSNTEISGSPVFLEYVTKNTVTAASNRTGFSGAGMAATAAAFFSNLMGKASASAASEPPAKTILQRQQEAILPLVSGVTYHSGLYNQFDNAISLLLNPDKADAMRKEILRIAKMHITNVRTDSKSDVQTKFSELAKVLAKTISLMMGLPITDPVNPGMIKLAMHLIHDWARMKILLVPPSDIPYTQSQYMNAFDIGPELRNVEPSATATQVLHDAGAGGGAPSSSSSASSSMSAEGPPPIPSTGQDEDAAATELRKQAIAKTLLPLFLSRFNVRGMKQTDVDNYLAQIITLITLDVTEKSINNILDLYRTYQRDTTDHNAARAYVAAVKSFHTALSNSSVPANNVIHAQLLSGMLASANAIGANLPAAAASAAATATTTSPTSASSSSSSGASSSSASSSATTAAAPVIVAATVPDALKNLIKTLGVTTLHESNELNKSLTDYANELVPIDRDILQKINAVNTSKDNPQLYLESLRKLKTAIFPYVPPTSLFSVSKRATIHVEITKKISAQIEATEENITAAARAARSQPKGQQQQQQKQPQPPPTKEKPVEADPFKRAVVNYSQNVKTQSQDLTSIGPVLEKIAAITIYSKDNQDVFNKLGKEDLDSKKFVSQLITQNPDELKALNDLITAFALKHYGNVMQDGSQGIESMQFLSNLLAHALHQKFGWPLGLGLKKFCMHLIHSRVKVVLQGDERFAYVGGKKGNETIAPAFPIKDALTAAHFNDEDRKPDAYNSLTIPTPHFTESEEAIIGFRTYIPDSGPTLDDLTENVLNQTYNYPSSSSSAAPPGGPAAAPAPMTVEQDKSAELLQKSYEEIYPVLIKLTTASNDYANKTTHNQRDILAFKGLLEEFKGIYINATASFEALNKDNTNFKTAYDADKRFESLLTANLQVGYLINEGLSYVLQQKTDVAGNYPEEPNIQLSLTRLNASLKEMPALKLDSPVVVDAAAAPSSAATKLIIEFSMATWSEVLDANGIDDYENEVDENKKALKNEWQVMIQDALEVDLRNKYCKDILFNTIKDNSLSAYNQVVDSYVEYLGNHPAYKDSALTTQQIKERVIAKMNVAMKDYIASGQFKGLFRDNKIGDIGDINDYTVVKFEQAVVKLSAIQEQNIAKTPVVAAASSSSSSAPSSSAMTASSTSNRSGAVSALIISTPTPATANASKARAGTDEQLRILKNSLETAAENKTSFDSILNEITLAASTDPLKAAIVKDIRDGKLDTLNSLLNVCDNALGNNKHTLYTGATADAESKNLMTRVLTRNIINKIGEKLGNDGAKFIKEHDEISKKKSSFQVKLY